MARGTRIIAQAELIVAGRQPLKPVDEHARDLRGESMVQARIARRAFEGTLEKKTFSKDAMLLMNAVGAVSQAIVTTQEAIEASWWAAQWKGKERMEKQLYRLTEMFNVLQEERTARVDRERSNLAAKVVRAV